MSWTLYEASYPLSVLSEVISEDRSKGRIGLSTRTIEKALAQRGDMIANPAKVAEAPWSVAEWAVAPRFNNPRATVPVLLLG